MASFLHKMRLLLWKNWLLRKRHPFVSLCEFVIPVLTFVLIAYTRSKIQTFGKQYVNTSTYMEPISTSDFYNSKFKLTDGKLLFTPKTKFTSDLMEEVQLKLNVRNSDLLGFNSELDLLIYYENTAKNYTIMAVVFNLAEANEIPTFLNYKIRPHEESVTWYTDQLYYNFPQYIPGTGSEVYIEKGFMALQLAIETSYIEMVSGAKLPNIFLQEFPIPPHLNDIGINDMFNYILPIVTVFSFVTLCLSVLKRVVEEKNTGIKELIKILGLKSWMHWMGWFIHAFVPSLLAVCCITFLMKVKMMDTPYPPIEHCSPWILLVFLLLYCVAGIAFSFAFSTLFSKPTIAMISGILIWLVPYFVFKSIVSQYPMMKWSYKIIISLFPNMALEFGFKAISVYEGREIGLHWNNFMKAGSEGVEDMSMLSVMIMLIIDIVFYVVLALYIDNINPGPYGLAKPYYYPFLNLKKFVSRFNREIKVDDDSKLINEDTNENIEPADYLKSGIKIRKLHKKYGTKKAVCGLSMDIYQDQITALLGHNGAGKTTTLSILTGMIQLTSGEIEINGTIIGPNSGNKDLDEIRNLLGLCPQQNLHFKDLTVFEHLLFFGMLRGSDPKDVRIEAEDLLQKLNLNNKRNYMPSSLSGGMKRKLSLGMALIGHSKILILDEPTSGLDPEARREIWDMLLNFRGSRTIIISTHFMEEADVLGDRIAIMDHGQLVCYGTSMFLKKIYGTGYHLKVSVNSETEDSMRVNRESFSTVENIVKSCIPKAEIEQRRGNSCNILLPLENKPDYSKVLEKLELNKKELNISNINLTYTTLEEVFLRVENIAAKERGERKSETGSENMKNMIDPKKTGLALHMQRFLILMKKRFLVSKKMRKVTILQIVLPLLLTLTTVYFSSNNNEHFIEKEPSLLLDLSLYGKPFVYYNAPSSGDLLKVSHYYDQVVSKQNGIPLRVDSVSNEIINKGIENIVSYKTRLVVAAEFNETGNDSILNAMYSNTALHGAPISLNMLMNALLKTLKDPSYSISVKNDPLPVLAATKSLNQQSSAEVAILWLFLFPLGLLFAISGFLLFPQMENMTSSKQLQLMCGIRPEFYWSTTYLFDLIFYFLVILLQLLGVGMMCAFVKSTFIGANEVDALVAIMAAYGVSGIPFSYLFSYKKSAASAFVAFIISSLFLGTILTVIVLVLELSGAAYYERIGEVLRYIFPVLPQFGMTYTSVRFAIKAVSNYNWMLKSDDDKKRKCYFDHNPCCDGEYTSQCFTYRSYLYSPKEGISTELMVMIASSLGYMVILAIIETNFGKKVQDWFSTTILQMIHPDKSVEQLDREVKNEHDRVHNTLKREKSIKLDVTDTAREDSPDVLLVDNLQKTFGRKKVVRGISFGVDKRECFGLLGVNGAGKTTTFRMLTGSEPCTGGDARIYDNAFFSINDQEYLQRVGYCPQFDAINELLPGRVILELFAKLRGLAEEECKKEVESWINVLGLAEWADQPCGEYSGGNKRKLSMAIALIGNQPVTMLDEPTSGVDPASRRKLWNVLSEIQMDTNRNCNPIILTSHSMEECEVLCNKLAIMKDGQLQCLGTIPQLKQKYGQGFTVYLKLKPMLSIVTHGHKDTDALLPPNEDDKRIQKLKEDFESQYSCELKDEHSGLLHYHINDSSITWSKLFKKIEELKSRHTIIEDYNISETTLEEVFLLIARSK
ncbi:retinal-specific ATP-binding cassette transporter [Agrilus planipennis]|uniref:Retinal-specific ATP-binding cassette transporter n=1 Tax=Agrilus planipennis TaxID=224129 RepID=A0A1W4WY30_AGRPL|nr:retinal-specific ATP-binding cassette transporter [Agrilus planipennis]